MQEQKVEEQCCSDYSVRKRLATVVKTQGL